MQTEFRRGKKARELLSEDQTKPNKQTPTKVGTGEVEVLEEECE
jgi:hypothetical protein